MAATVLSSTPALRPRQPAWAAATVVPSRSHSSTGRQSAIRTAHTLPGRRAMQASACGGIAVASASTTRVPCTCCNQHGSAGKCARRRSRLARTRRGVVVDVGAEVQAVEGRAADAAVARGDQAAHAGGRRPVRHDPVSGQRHAVASRTAGLRSRRAGAQSQVKRSPLSGCMSASRVRVQRLAPESCVPPAAPRERRRVRGRRDRRAPDGRWRQVHADLVRAAGFQAAFEQAPAGARAAHAVVRHGRLACARPRPCACAAPDGGRSAPRPCPSQAGRPARAPDSRAGRCAPEAGAPGWFALQASSRPPAVRWCPCPADARCRHAAREPARERDAAGR